MEMERTQFPIAFLLWLTYYEKGFSCDVRGGTDARSTKGQICKV